MATKVNVLTDCRVVVEPTPHAFWVSPRTVEERGKILDRWAVDLYDFFRDHRSMDVNSVDVERVYEDQCSECHRPWDTFLDEEQGNAECCAWCGAVVENIEARQEARAR